MVPGTISGNDCGNDSNHWNPVGKARTASGSSGDAQASKSDRNFELGVKSGVPGLFINKERETSKNGKVSAIAKRRKSFIKNN